jgi:nitrite reductase/ring-hydroxylating ferredoxin subunit
MGPMANRSFAPLDVGSVTDSLTERRSCYIDPFARSVYQLQDNEAKLAFVEVNASSQVCPSEGRVPGFDASEVQDARVLCRLSSSAFFLSSGACSEMQRPTLLTYSSQVGIPISACAVPPSSLRPLPLLLCFVSPLQPDERHANMKLSDAASANRPQDERRSVIRTPFPSRAKLAMRRL